MSDIIQFDRYNVGDIFENVDVDFDSRENVLALNFHVNRFFHKMPQLWIIMVMGLLKYVNIMVYSLLMEDVV